MTIFDDFEKLKKMPFSQITVIFGEDDELVVNTRDELMQFIKFDPENLSQSYFDLAESRIDTALEELESLPFFSDQRTVILENMWDISTAKKSLLNKEQLSRFEHFLDEPVATTQLILIVHGKLDSRQKIVKKLKTKSTLLEAKPLTPQELQRYFVKKSTLTPQIVIRIAEKSNFSFAVTQKNIELLKTYAGGKPLTLEDVEKVVPKSLQDNIFDLTDLVFKKKIKLARELVSDLVIQGEDIIKILAILTNSFRLYYQVKLMQEKGWNEAQQTNFLKIHPYRVKLANQAVYKLQKTYLKNVLQSLIELDYAIKSGNAEKELLFDIQLSKLILT